MLPLILIPYPVLMAVVDALQDLLDAMRGVRFTVEFTSHNVLEKLTSSHTWIRILVLESNLLKQFRVEQTRFWIVPEMGQFFHKYSLVPPLEFKKMNNILTGQRRGSGNSPLECYHVVALQGKKYFISRKFSLMCYCWCLAASAFTLSPILGCWSLRHILASRSNFWKSAERWERNSFMLMEKWIRKFAESYWTS